MPAGLVALTLISDGGVTITKVVSVTPTMATVEVEVAAGLPVGKHDLAIGRASTKEALAVFDKIAYIEVEPDAQMSKLGGIKWPKEYAQFEAIVWAAVPMVRRIRMTMFILGLTRPVGGSRNLFRRPMTTMLNTSARWMIPACSRPTSKAKSILSAKKQIT